MDPLVILLKEVASNENPHMLKKVTWESVQDRYKRLQEELDSSDIRNSGLLGVAGSEMGKLYPALSQMREERDSIALQKDAAKADKSRKDEENEKAGRDVVQMALLRALLSAAQMMDAW